MPIGTSFCRLHRQEHPAQCYLGATVVVAGREVTLFEGIGAEGNRIPGVGVGEEEDGMELASPFFKRVGVFELVDCVLWGYWGHLLDSSGLGLLLDVRRDSNVR